MLRNSRISYLQVLDGCFTGQHTHLIHRRVQAQRMTAADALRNLSSGTLFDVLGLESHPPPLTESRHAMGRQCHLDRPSGITYNGLEVLDWLNDYSAHAGNRPVSQMGSFSSDSVHPQVCAFSQRRACPD